MWLLDADLKPLTQRPAGTGTFQTVPEQLEILDRVQQVLRDQNTRNFNCAA